MNQLVIGIDAGRLEGDRRHGPAKALDLPNRVMNRLVHAFRRQRQRSALAQLDEHLLRDIGISREQARAESDKPIWRA